MWQGWEPWWWLHSSHSEPALSVPRIDRSRRSSRSSMVHGISTPSGVIRCHRPRRRLCGGPVQPTWSVVLLRLVGEAGVVAEAEVMLLLVEQAAHREVPVAAAVVPVILM